MEEICSNRKVEKEGSAVPERLRGEGVCSTRKVEGEGSAVPEGLRRRGLQYQEG
jgi:uncharacterized membrane-anchored protein